MMTDRMEAELGSRAHDSAPAEGQKRQRTGDRQGCEEVNAGCERSPDTHTTFEPSLYSAT